MTRVTLHAMNGETQAGVIWSRHDGYIPKGHAEIRPLNDDGSLADYVVIVPDSDYTED